VVNSGNANCATGKPGIEGCESVCRAVAEELGCAPTEIFPSSTGVIGVPFPADKLVNAVPSLVSSRRAEPDAARHFARAIMTTDTRMKIAASRFQRGKSEVTVFGVAKGAGMIHPRLATMLVYIFSDIDAQPGELQPVLAEACRVSFNRVSIDGDTSTNDTVLLLAGGASAVKLATVSAQFAAALTGICQALAKQIVTDGEGVRHVVNLHIEGARDDQEASLVAKAISNSALVKTAWAGSDPNWGRILAAVGYSGAAVNPAKVDIFFGRHQVCQKGMAAPFNDAEVHTYLSQPVFDVRVRLGSGKVSGTFWTCDLTAEYVRINADYRT
jgi:glutamate N-acetyltransferase/amino-acid N-acetyltransferase